MSLKQVKRRTITLIEILVVITIIAMMSGLLAINIREAHASQRFRTEVDTVIDALRFAQELMLIVGLNVHFMVKESEDGNGRDYWLEVERPVPERWEWLLDRFPRKLIEAKYFSFEEENTFNQEPGETNIRFLSGGSSMSKGVITLATSEDLSDSDTMIRAICLYGSPRPIISRTINPGEEITCGEDEGDQALDQRMTTLMVSELNRVAEMKKQSQSTEQQQGSNDPGQATQNP